MKCGACNGDGRAYSCGAPVRCSACSGRGTVKWLGDPDSDPDRPHSAPPTPGPDLPPDYPGLTDPDGAMVAFHVRCVDQGRIATGWTPYLPAYLAGWFLAACRAPAPNGDLGQFRDSIRGGYADCVERQARRVQYQARPVECERADAATDLDRQATDVEVTYGRHEPGAVLLRRAAARIRAGKHREEPE